MPVLKKQLATVELASGEVVDVRIINPDVLRFEETAQRHGWAEIAVDSEGNASAAFLTRRNTFQAWAALKRTGQYAGTWEQFAGADCVDLAVEEEAVDPTRLVPDSGSSPSSLGSDAAPSPSSETPPTS